MSPKFFGAKVAMLQNSGGNRLRGPKLCGVKVEGSKTPRGKCAFNLCPVEFWTPQPLPHGKQCNLGPWSFGDIVLQKISEN